jgi:hypothetical protein
VVGREAPKSRRCVITCWQTPSFTTACSAWS